MKVAILSTNDLLGGAARCAYRLHQGLLSAGIDSQMLVQNKLSDEHSIIAPKSKFQRAVTATKPTIDKLPFLLHRNRDRTIANYSAQWLPDQTIAQIEQFDPDIVNLHWINGGFMPIEALARLHKPIIWTCHDMWAFTGGCHYSGKCDRFTQLCGACPQLGSNRERDLSRWIWQRKAKAWQNLNLTVTPTSNWLADLARRSSLLQNYPVQVIPSGVDTKLYRPRDRHFARQVFNLPTDKQIILFGAVSATSDYRKGFHLLMPALSKLQHHQNSAEVELVVFGASQPEEPPDLGFKTRYLGKLNDDVSLALLYAAADVLIAPSLEDNLPNTVMEAMACGTPCVAFDVGGICDLIDDEQNGYLASAYEPEDLARGVAWVLKPQHWQRLSHNAVDKIARRFSVARQVAQYRQLYTQILTDRDEN